MTDPRQYPLCDRCGDPEAYCNCGTSLEYVAPTDPQRPSPEAVERETFEQTCKRCKGVRWVDDPNYHASHMPCGSCGGKGVVLPKASETSLSWVRKYAPRCKDEDCYWGDKGRPRKTLYTCEDCTRLALALDKALAAAANDGADMAAEICERHAADWSKERGTIYYPERLWVFAARGARNIANAIRSECGGSGVAG